MNINVSGFPYKKMRDQQKHILRTIDNNWDKRFVVIEAPPGVGKSGIAMTLLSSVKNGFLITSTKQLQDQYIRDFSSDYRYDIESIKGRQNYTCKENENLTCDMGECLGNKALLSECIDNGVCPYYNQKSKTIRSNIALTSYQYFFRFADCEPKIRSWQIRDMLLFDEAHLLEQQLVGWASIELIPSKLNEELNVFKTIDMDKLVEIFNLPSENGYEKNKKWIMSIADCIKDARESILLELKESLKTDKDIDDDQIEQLLSDHTDYVKIDQLFKKFSLFFKNKKEDWLVEVIEGGLSLTPLKVDGIFNTFIKKWGNKKIVFMSATILNAKAFCKEFGMDENDVVVVRAQSTFDAKKSPIIYNPVCKMNYDKIDENLPNIAKEVEKIMNNHKGQKGIIHTTNYKITKYLYDNINTDRFIIKTNDITNEDMINMHEQSTKDTILLSPSLTTGADLKDDLGRFSIVIKLPWSSLTNSRVQVKMKEDEDWYPLEMFKTFIQSCGRTTRSESDWSTTYILDAGFSYWVLKYRKWFTPQFLKRIKWN